MRYCKSTIFQANHNGDGALWAGCVLFAILQKYDFSSKSQRQQQLLVVIDVVCDTAKVRFFKQITTAGKVGGTESALFAILQKYDFSSKSQLPCSTIALVSSCLRYCKSTIFQANHNYFTPLYLTGWLFAIQHNVTTSTHLVTPRDPITQ